MNEMVDVACKVLVICGALMGAGAIAHVCGRVLAATWSRALDGWRRAARWWRQGTGGRLHGPGAHDLPRSPPRVLEVQEQPWRGRAPLRDPETTQPGMPALPAPEAEPEVWLGCTCSGAPHASTCPLSTDRTAVTRRERSGAPPPVAVDVVELGPARPPGCRCAAWPFECRTGGCTCEACHGRS